MEGREKAGERQSASGAEVVGARAGQNRSRCTAPAHRGTSTRVPATGCEAPPASSRRCLSVHRDTSTVTPRGVQREVQQPRTPGGALSGCVRIDTSSSAQTGPTTPQLFVQCWSSPALRTPPLPPGGWLPGGLLSGLCFLLSRGCLSESELTRLNPDAAGLPPPVALITL